MTKLTEARHRALKEVADGKIVYYMADRVYHAWSKSSRRDS
jgi:hypothetical protein